MFIELMVSMAKFMNCLAIISNYHASTINYSISHITYQIDFVVSCHVNTEVCLYSVRHAAVTQPQNSKTVGILLPSLLLFIPCSFSNLVS